MTIDIRVHPKFAKRVLQRRLVDVVYKTLHQYVSDVSITVYVTTNAEIRALAHRRRNRFAGGAWRIAFARL